MQVRVLGCAGGIGQDLRTTSYLVDNTILLDGGTGIGDLTLKEMRAIRHIILSHAHLDHIAGFALMLASIYDDREASITLYAPASVISALKNHLMNWQIWPDFNLLPSAENPILHYNILEEEQQTTIANDYQVEAVLLTHTVDSFAYIISTEQTRFCFCGDTGPTERLWQYLNTLDTIENLIIEVSLPNENEELAVQSAHLTPALLAQDLLKLTHSPRIHIQHMKPGCEAKVIEQCQIAFKDLDTRIVAQETYLPLAPKSQAVSNDK